MDWVGPGLNGQENGLSHRHECVHSLSTLGLYVCETICFMFLLPHFPCYGMKQKKLLIPEVTFIRKF